MREIKIKYVFKHNNTNKIIYYFLNLDMLESVAGRNNVREEMSAFEFNEFSLVDKLQYTGLKDHSTEIKELYDHDILQDEKGDHYEIFWSDGSWCIEEDNGDIQILNQSFIDANYMVHVGNAYENPELTEVK